MNSGKKISLIIPCYNSEKYIDRCFDSIRKQTVDFNGLEIIFVDDLSTDGTLEKLKKIESEYPDQIIVVQHSGNGGPRTARNTGLGYAGGEYVSFVDADDTLKPGMLEALLEACEQYKCQAAECGYEVFSDDSPPGDGTGPVVCHHYLLDETDKKRQFVPDSLRTAAWGRLYRRDFILDNDISFPDGVLYEEDVYFSGLILFYIDSYCRIENRLYNYYRNDSGITRSSYDRKRSRKEIRIIDRLISELRSRGLLDRAMTELKSEFEFFCIWKGCLDPFRKIFNTNMAWKDQMDEAMFYADHIGTIFPDSGDNVYLKEIKGDFYDVSRHLIMNARRAKKKASNA